MEKHILYKNKLIFPKGHFLCNKKYIHQKEEQES